ncbi:MAG: DUF1653 domain-containing protein [Anaeroplasmataceae bacterium]
MNKLINNGIYKHFKGNLYLVIDTVYHSETKEEYVLYKAFSDDKLYIRPKDMFLSNIDKVKYPEVNQEYRFEYIKNND